MPRSRTRTAALVTAGVIALGGGATAVTLANADPSTSPSTAPSGAPSGAPSAPAGAPDGGPQGHGRGGPGVNDDQLVSQLASKLGVSEAKVKTALQAARDEVKPTKPTTPPTPGTKPDPSAHEAALAKALASKLGVDEAKVTAALDDIRAARDAERTAAFDKKIAQAVTDGKLTQAEADAVLKAQKLGLLGPR